MPDGTRLGPERSSVAEECIPGSLGVAFRNGQDWDISVFSLLCSSDFELFRFEGLLNLSSKKTLLVSMCSWHGEPPASVHTVCIKCRIALDIRKQS